MQRRPFYLWMEALRLAMTAGAVFVYDAWFGGASLPWLAQATIGSVAVASFASFWLIFKPLPSSHGYLSHQ